MTEAKVDSLSFEQAMKELEEIVRKLEGGAGDLDSSIKDYMRGTALQQHCQKKLAEARLKVDSIVKDQNQQGDLSLKAFDEQSGS